MEYEFSSRTPIVQYRSRPHVAFSHRAPLLWPAYAYRVVAPKIRDRQLNLFEKAILGLMLAGEARPEQIARLLALHPDLIRFIQVRLHERGLAGTKGMLTPQGADFLAAERDLGYEMAVAHVFQDPWSRRLWPRVVEELNIVDGHPFESGNNVLVTLNTVGDPVRFVAYARLPTTGFGPRKPEVAEILQAVRRHRREMRAGEMSEEVEDEPLGVEPETPLIQRVSLIDEEPKPLLLSTYIYLVDQPDDYTWYACDPFGLGQSVGLREDILRQITQDGHLKRIVEDLLGKRLPTEAHLSEQLNVYQEQAVLAIHERMPGLENSAPEVYEALVAMERDWRAMRPSSPRDRLDDVVVKAAKVLEALFDYLQHAFHVENAADAMPKRDGTFAKQWLTQTAGTLGFDGLHESLTTVRPNAIQRAYNNKNGTLGQRLWAVLLSAREDPQHPIRRAAAQAPDLLRRLGQLTQIRGKSAHFTNKQLDYGLVQAQIATTYEAVVLLLGS